MLVVGNHLGIVLESSNVMTVILFIPMRGLGHAAMTAADVLYRFRDIAPVFYIEIVGQFRKCAADRSVSMYSFIFSYESADIMGILKIGNAYERFSEGLLK